jgi:glycosyltransferase involved in cell wall biosynthesis
LENLISVIVPVYNVENFLPRCVDSLLRQTYTNIEIILINDGSTDQSGVICDVYGKKDARVKVFHQENKGLSGARNAGVFFAKGDYVAFVDSDDFIADTMLERLYNLLVQNNCDIAQCRYLKFDDDKKIKLAQNTNYKTEISDSCGFLKEFFLSSDINNTVVWNKLYKSELVFNLPFIEGKTNEDEFWTYKVFAAAKNIVVTNEELYYYYQRPDSIMGSKFSIARLDIVEAKLQQQEFVEKNLPQLATSSKCDLWFCCIYALQMSKVHLQGSDLAKAAAIVKNAVKKYPLNSDDKKHLSGKNKLWMSMFKKMPAFTVKLRNLLRIGL